jgi:regulator of PEP synthase PpsR (kinase-PPPase family)
MENGYKIFVLSDSIGETAEMVTRATVEQFKGFSYEIIKYSYVNNEEQVMDIMDEAKKFNSIIVFTTVLHNLRDKLAQECEKADICYIDVMKPLLDIFSQALGRQPELEPGIIHRLDEKYFRKVEAVEFAVKYDDGKDPRGIKKADIVLIGVSRTSKTPLSMYLAHRNIKVANVPLVPEVPVPKELSEIDPSKIIGLTTDPVKLNEIRIERLKALGLKNTANYADVNRILEELEYADGVMKKIGCPVIDVASKAVEETANIIIDIINGRY